MVDSEEKTRKGPKCRTAHNSTPLRYFIPLLVVQPLSQPSSLLLFQESWANKAPCKGGGEGTADREMDWTERAAKEGLSVLGKQ